MGVDHSVIAVDEPEDELEPPGRVGCSGVRAFSANDAVVNGAIPLPKRVVVGLGFADRFPGRRRLVYGEGFEEAEELFPSA